MGDSATPHDSGSPDDASIDLWKFFEQRGAEQKESLFKLVTWIVGFAAVNLGFTVKEGFQSKYETIAHPGLLVILSGVGLVVLVHAFFIVRDHGRHINRTFARADAARDGKVAPREIWAAGKKAEGEPLPPICKQLLIAVGMFALAFAVLIIVGLFWPATELLPNCL